MKIQEITARIRARAVAREFPKEAFPLKIGGKYQRDSQGHLQVTLDGMHPIEAIREIHNADVFVSMGKNWLGDIMIGVKATTLQYVAVGSGTTAPAAGDTDVQTIIGARHLYTDRFRSGTVVTVSTFFSSSENNGTWGNAGLFTAVTSGDMLCHSTFASPVTKSTANTQSVDFDITISG